MNLPPPSPAAPATGWWARFCGSHLHDYTPRALRFWVAIAGGGAAALLWSFVTLAERTALGGWPSLWPVLAGLVAVAVAACFPLPIPRTTKTVLVADVFIFTMLAALGAPAAVLAAGVEAAIASLRTNRRLSSRISGPAAAMASMAVCALAYVGLRALLMRLGMAVETAGLAALCLAAPLPVAVSLAAMLAMMAAKRGERFLLADWTAAAGWFLAMGLGSAFVAGLLHLNAQRFGPAVLAIAATLVIVIVALLGQALQRHERERQTQDALVAEAQQAAARSQQRFMAAFTHAAIGMAIVRPDGGMLQVNQALCDLLRLPEARLLGEPFDSLLHPDDAQLFEREAAGVLGGRDRTFSMELRCQAVEGGALWVVLHCSRYADPGGETGAARPGSAEPGVGAGDCLIYQLHDITSRYLAESRLHHIAYHDGLTDLANRTSFHERLAAAVERTRLDADVRFAVLFLDLDRFKIVNDSLGHIAGNELLREVAVRLRGCLRPGDLVARLGGDEFALLLEDLHDAEAGMRLARRVLATLSEPMAIRGTEVQPAASIGITFSDLGYRTVDEVLRDADLAMYEAKAGGRGRVALFDSSMHERVAEKLALEGDLRRAIGEGQLSVQFQPLYLLEPFGLYGFEALARWEHPQRGAISPAVFITLAEESGHIEALTDWVVNHAVAQLAQWQRNTPGIGDLGMHVNISARDLARSDLATTVQHVLQQHGLAPSCLTLEITETTLMGGLDVALQTMARLRETGVRFSIDDFGTGYSSLAYLGTLPIDSLKIDRSFVMGLHDSPQNVEIVRAVLNLGQSLGRKVIAEGIETAEQLATLRSLGVPIGQGYLLSRPLRAAQVVELLSVAPIAA